MNFKTYLIWFIAVNFLVINAFIDPQLALSFFKAKHLGRSMVVTCLNHSAKVQLAKLLMKHNLCLVTNFKAVLSSKRLGVVVDANCKETQHFMVKASKLNLFNSSHFWLVLLNSNTTYQLFKYVNLNINAEVTVTIPSSTGLYDVYDVYNPAFERGGQLKISKIGIYNSTGGFNFTGQESKYMLRRNFDGVQFKTVVVLPEPFEGSVETYLKSDRDLHINTFNRFHSRLMHYCATYNNFSMNIDLDKSWGYMRSDGTMDGLVGDLIAKKIDFGLSPLFIKKSRADFISYGRKTWNLRAAFILRNPKSRKSYQIFIRPLDTKVWICVIALSCIAVLLQMLSYKLDWKLSNWSSEEKKHVDFSWGFSAVSTFGAFCQQGIIAFPSLLSGRIAAYMTLLLGLLTYQFYSASLVSFLLNVPTTVITTVQGILDNDFEIGCEDVLYDRDFLKYATDNVTKEVLKRLSTSNNNRTGFLKLREGLNLVKRGKYAFHVELVSGYPLIAKEFDGTTICELKEVPMFATQQVHASYQKGSPFKDVLDICLHRLSENGVIQRELHFWHPRKPECVRSANTIVINTGLEDFYPALCVLLAGIILSLEILGIEYFFYRSYGTPLFPFVN